MWIRNIMGLVPWLMLLFLVGCIASLAALTIYLIVSI